MTSRDTPPASGWESWQAFADKRITALADDYDAQDSADAEALAQARALMDNG